MEHRTDHSRGHQVSPASPRVFGATLTGAPPPKICNRSTDVDVPLSAWSNWIPDDGPRQLRRPLTAEERRALEVRRDELAPWVAPTDPRQEELVTLAALEMFGSFHSMRQTGEEAEAIADSLVRSLKDLPAWATIGACRAIHQNGVWRERDGFGKFDRQWPPNDSEVRAAASKLAALYGDQHRSAVALLEATVEEGSGK